MPLGNRLQLLLGSRGVGYELLPPPADVGSQPTDDSGHQYAKSVLIAIDGRMTLAVLPVDRTVDMHKVTLSVGAHEAEAADENDLESVWPDGELAAEAPINNLCGLPVIMDAELCEGHQITIKGGAHEHAIRMNLIDLLKVLRPRV